MSKRRHIRKRTRFRIMARDLCACRECGVRHWPWWDEWQMGHLLPVAAGGGNWRNLALICQSCNQRIGAKTWKPERPLRWWQKALDWFLILFYDWPDLADLRGK